jgi:hypothetical protein
MMEPESATYGRVCLLLIAAMTDRGMSREAATWRLAETLITFGVEHGLTRAEIVAAISESN